MGVGEPGTTPAVALMPTAGGAMRKVTGSQPGGVANSGSGTSARLPSVIGTGHVGAEQGVTLHEVDAFDRRPVVGVGVGLRHSWCRRRPLRGGSTRHLP